MDTPQLHDFAQTLERLDVEPPVVLTRARAILTTGIETAMASPVPDLLEEFTAGSLTLEQFPERLRAAALQLAAKQHAHAVMQDLTRPMVRHATAAIRADGDRLIRDLRVRFDQAAAGMTTAGGLFDEQASPAHVLAAGPDAAAAWQRLAQDRTVLDDVLGARITMAQAGYGTTERRPLLFLAGITSLDAYGVAEQAFDRESGAGGRWHSAAAAGFALHLATADEVQAAVEQLQQAQAEQSAAARRGPRVSPQEQAANERNARDWQQALQRTTLTPAS